MCSHGESTESETSQSSLDHLGISYRMACQGYSVAFIDDITFQSSKAYVSITTPTASLGSDDEDEVDLSAVNDNNPTMEGGSPLGDDPPDSLPDESMPETDDIEFSTDTEDTESSMSDDEEGVSESWLDAAVDDDRHDVGTALLGRVSIAEDVASARDEMSRMYSLEGYTKLSARDIITVYGLSQVLQSGQKKNTMQRVAVHLVHLVILRYSKLAERSVSIKGAQLGPLHDAYLHQFTASASHKCQILVTVPHVLQIMLLSPSNANKAGAWATRVKRIIFDEVHCIGQSEDGVIWEQLLLLAPCPVIALSATVGNPLEFKKWLESTARGKGFDFEMVVHGSRYSDLRKFLYEAPPLPDFKGFTPVEGLPFPGLDAADHDTTRFAFVHPIGALIGKSLDSLNDCPLEPRDCLSLWHCMIKHQNEQYPVPKALNPKNFFAELAKKSDVVRWEASLKEGLGIWMTDPASPFDAVRDDLLGKRCERLVQDSSRKPRGASKGKSGYDLGQFSLLLDLRKSGALPAILFNYDRTGCEISLFGLLHTLETKEAEYREGSSVWAAKMAEFEKWKRSREKMRFKAPKASKQGRGDDEEGSSRLDMAREEANRESSAWESFDPDAPLTEFSLADMTKISMGELEKQLESLKWRGCKPELSSALRRGLGVHHAGMNRQYRQIVEMLFRKGYLNVVIATGTLALGLNMPCKTVVFTGDSVFLSALNYRQASGRAGRRGFDLLGNVVFHGIPPHRALEIMSARLPDLRGQFPTSVTLILRLMTLLHGTNNSDYASTAVKSLLTQSQLFLGGPDARQAIQHHLRFALDYLQQQNLLSETGAPIGLSGLVGHLYYTENSAFAFHSLLNGRYFHKLCADINTSSPTKRTHILRNLVLVLSHLFGTIPVVKYKDQAWLDNVVHRSPSVVILPELPKLAAQILMKHNKSTLRGWYGYVSTYVSQHLSDVADDQLPYTKRRVHPSSHTTVNITDILHSRPATGVRSPFAALSGFTDKFRTVGELCQTVRSGVFLEESAVPYVRITDQERGGVPWNAYLYDFFKHGDLTALVRDNGIKRGDVWFALKDFSLVLATITASLANLLDPDAANIADDAMIDIQDVGGEIEETTVASYSPLESSAKTVSSAVADSIASLSIKSQKKKKKVVDSWEDEDNSESDGEQPPAASSSPPFALQTGESLINVHKAFVLLQQEFDEKFRKIWA